MILLDKIIPLLALWSSFDGNQNLTWNELEYGFWAKGCSFNDTVPLNNSWIIQENVKNFFKCYLKCIENNECTHFTYEQSKKQCFLSKADIQKTSPVISNLHSCGLLSLAEIQWKNYYQFKNADNCKMKFYRQRFYSESLESCFNDCFENYNCISYFYGTEKNICYILDYTPSAELVVRDGDFSCGIKKILKWIKDRDGKRAYGCYFNSTSIEVKMLSSFDECYNACYNLTDCTNANWINESKCVLNSGNTTTDQATIDDEISSDCLIINPLDWDTENDGFACKNCHFPQTKTIMTFESLPMYKCNELCLENENCTHFEIKFSSEFIGKCVLKSGKVEKGSVTRRERVDSKIIRKLKWFKERNGFWAHSCQFRKPHNFDQQVIEKIESNEACIDLCLRSEICVSYFWNKQSRLCTLNVKNKMSQSTYIEPLDFVFPSENDTTCGYEAFRWRSSRFSVEAYRCKFSNTIAFANITDVDYEGLCEFRCNQLRNCTHYDYFGKEKVCSLKGGNVTKDDAVFTNSYTFCGIMNEIVWKNISDWLVAEKCTFDWSFFNITQANSSDECREYCSHNQYCDHFLWDKFSNSCLFHNGHVSESDVKGHWSGICGFEKKKTKLNWKFDFYGPWAAGCQYSTENSIKEIENSSDTCRFKCAETNGCTHYNWFQEKKLCELIFNSSTENFSPSNDTSICGQIKNNWNKTDDVWLSSNCFLFDHSPNQRDTKNVFECYQFCKDTKNCTSFVFDNSNLFRYYNCLTFNVAVNQTNSKFVIGSQCGWLKD